MNKKAYIQPTMAVRNICMEQLICASPGDDPKVGGTTDQEEDLLSREVKCCSVWDDEEYDAEEEF